MFVQLTTRTKSGVVLVVSYGDRLLVQSTHHKMRFSFTILSFFLGDNRATPIRLTSAQRALVRGSTLSPTPQDLTPSRIMSPVTPRPLSLPSPSVSPFKSLHSPTPLSPTEHVLPEQENVFSKCRNILLSCEVVVDRSKTGALGHGRHAEVYKALVHPPQQYSKIISLQSVTCRDLFETSQGVACAAKCLLSDPQSVEAGRAEDDILKRLQHRSEHHLGRQFVVDYIGLYDTSTNNIEYRPGSDNSSSPPPEAQKCLLLEYCAGGTIWDWIRHHPEMVGLQQWLVWARQLLLAVDYIHEAGLIHHDIKPHNILVRVYHHDHHDKILFICAQQLYYVWTLH